MRWSLVPLWAASSKVYHARAAFHYACWSSGEFRCTPGSAEYWRDCAEDRRGTAYRGGLRIPPHLPDGEYVLGFVWYGGYVGDHHSEYGDYYDCARVRVRGGVRQAGSFTPTWAPGRGEFHDSCRASVNRVGTCWREPCKGFQGGRLKVRAQRAGLGGSRVEGMGGRWNGGLEGSLRTVASRQWRPWTAGAVAELGG